MPGAPRHPGVCGARRRLARPLSSRRRARLSCGTPRDSATSRPRRNLSLAQRRSSSRRASTASTCSGSPAVPSTSDGGSTSDAGSLPLCSHGRFLQYATVGGPSTDAITFGRKSAGPPTPATNPSPKAARTRPRGRSGVVERVVHSPGGDRWGHHGALDLQRKRSSNSSR